MTILSADRRAETARAFGLWRSARSTREGDKYLVQLWVLSQPEIARALQDVAGGQRSVRAWLNRRGLTFEEIANAVFPAVKDAASRYDPSHESGAGFSTFALKHIKGAVARIAMDSPPLAGPMAASGDPEVQPQEELHPEEESLDLADIMASVREHRRSDIIESVYQATRFPDEYSSEELRQAAALIEEQFAEELEQDAKLRALHSNLIVMSIRAESFVGSMVPIGTLWHILAVREYRRARGMPAEKYSSKALARVFGRPSPNTLTRWLRKCDEEGITVQNWTPAQLARIISSRRGPKFRGRLELPTSRPDE